MPVSGKSIDVHTILIKNLLFLLALIMPATVVVGFLSVPYIGSIGYFCAPILLFGVIPIAELIFGRAQVKPKVQTTFQHKLESAPWLVVCVIAAAHFSIVA